MKWRVLTVVLVVLACGVMAHGTGPKQDPPPVTDLTGTLGGVAYEIRVPANWQASNRALLVFAHPHQTGGPAPWPAPQLPGFEDTLLDMGYALAGSAFGDSSKEGVQRMHQLTTFFRDAVGNPARTIIWGNSFGGGIALKLIEKYSGIYDGAIANCAPSAGQLENMDSALAFSLAYDAAIGWREDLWGPVGDVRDDLAVSDVLPNVQWPSGQNPRPPEWQFIRLVMHLPDEAFWTGDPGSGGWKFYELQMWKATMLRSAAEREAGGPIAENVGAHYTVDADDAALAALGLTREWVDQKLAYMNDRANIAADRPARMHLEQWGAPTGDLRRPVLTMHCTNDGMAFVSHESYYRALVESAGSADLLLQTFIARNGHCAFTAVEYRNALAAMNAWLDTGVRPDPFDTTIFTSSFFRPAFPPGPWIF